MRAMVHLQCGRPQEVIDGIEELLSPYRVTKQSDALLVQAYMMTGEMERADAFAQIREAKEFARVIAELVE